MKDFFRTAWQANLGIRLGLIFNALLLLGALLALPFDHRLILGLNPWIKPMKFDISILIYLTTIGALLAWLGRFPKMQAIIGWGIGLAMIFENGIISLQSARGVRSHMNFATPRDAILFALMGLFVAVNTALLAWLLALYCITRTQWPRAVAWGARMGLAALLAGSVEGVYMIQHFQAHTVGAKDGGPGLPFVNWSTGHGDLRIAHFFALHALQMAMLGGWALARTRWPERRQVLILSLGFGLYMLVVWALFRQALAGHPLLG